MDINDINGIKGSFREWRVLATLELECFNVPISRYSPLRPFIPFIHLCGGIFHD